VTRTILPRTGLVALRRHRHVRLPGSPAAPGAQVPTGTAPQATSLDRRFDDPRPCTCAAIRTIAR